jgi:uncharacterized protein YjaG (DUF416 family)
MLEFDERKLRHKLSGLSSLKQLAFLLLLCERMMPELHRFAKDTGLDPTVYRDRLEQGWQHLAGTTKLQDYQALAKACLDGAPDTENFDHIFTSAALDAALSINHLMIFLSDHNVDHVAEAAGLARDTVALFVDRTEAPRPCSLTNEQVNGHRLMQRELRRQQEDLIFSENLPNDVDQEMFVRLRERSKRPPEMLEISAQV